MIRVADHPAAVGMTELEGVAMARLKPRRFKSVMRVDAHFSVKGVTRYKSGLCSSKQRKSSLGYCVPFGLCELILWKYRVKKQQVPHTGSRECSE
jgi:hypothetical protein